MELTRATGTPWKSDLLGDGDIARVFLELATVLYLQRFLTNFCIEVTRK
jgi:hypothetical protein